MMEPTTKGAHHQPQDFHDLMRFRIMDILLVCSPYDLFILEEAGHLNERMLGEYRNLDLHYSPGLTGASNGAEALELLRKRRFNLVITAPQLGDMSAFDLAEKVRAENPDLPVVMLGYDNRELKELVARHDTSALDGVFLWQGDARILLTIMKVIEDRRNVAHDTRSVGVQVVILIEDSVRYYSSFLPTIYTELFHQSRRVISEGANMTLKITRMRARPKILLCTSFEEAWEAFSAYKDDVLGVISDVEFPRGGQLDPEAGVEFARAVRNEMADIPVVLQSARPTYRDLAASVGAAFLLKGSPVLLNDLRRFMLSDFGFGDFVFRMPDGRQVARAADLRTLEKRLVEVPAESIAHHSAGNHFSRWLKARTDFSLAHALRPRKLSDFKDVEELRRLLIDSISAYREDRSQEAVADFDRDDLESTNDMCRIGGGSLGGKARGLAFARLLMGGRRLRHRYSGIRVWVPPSAVLATDVFDQFLEENGLRDLAIQSSDDAELRRQFEQAVFPERARRDLAAYLQIARYPLAVRSSSLLEDSHNQPLAGVYDTFMLSNMHSDPAVRLAQLIRAVKRVYASTFSQRARAYLRATPYRLEEEKMAVIIQKMVGSAHGNRFYPSFSGVVRSHNFDPTPPLKVEDGIAAVGLGLGRIVVEGGNCLRFSPAYPNHILQLSSVSDALNSTQREFIALELEKGGRDGDGAEMHEARFGLATAEEDGTLAPLASTYSFETDSLSDGTSRSGPRVISFAPILKQDLFPLCEVLKELMEIGHEGMSTPVEIEFAANLTPPPGEPRKFAFLQIRPVVVSHEDDDLAVGDVGPERVLCRSASVLGHGSIEGIRDLVVVDFKRFERARSREAAQEVARCNAELQSASRPYLLVGVGRWGSSDPWLGIPVTWEQISGARAIIEAGFRDFKVSPSQGTHFFQNLTSFNVGYFTVNPEAGEGWVDWDWLEAQPAYYDRSGVRHLRLDQPVQVRMNGRRNEGVILKPEA
jgi:CheY-like chemotaxis protein